METILYWAKPLKLWGVALVLIVFYSGLGARYLLEQNQKEPPTWAIPQYSELRRVTGVLQRSYLVPFRRGVQPSAWGRLSTFGSTALLGFTCDPGVGVPDCIYSKPWNEDKNIGLPLQFRYFDAPNKQGPTHVVMEIRGTGKYSNVVLLSYEKSRDRLIEFRKQSRWPSFLGWCLLLSIPAFAPGVIFRLATGYEAPYPRNTKPAQLGGV